MTKIRKAKNDLSTIRLVRFSQLGVCGLALILCWLDLAWINRLGLPNLFTLHLLVAIAIANALLQKKKQIVWESDLFCVCFGGAIVALTILRSQMPLGYHPHLSLFIFGIGLALIASGRKHLGLYKNEIFVLGILALYPLYHRIFIALNWTVLTAKASTLALNLVNITATQQENRVILPTGRVEVYGSCAGVDLVILLIMVVTLLILQFPINKRQKFYGYATAIAIAFIINSLRVAFLATLIAQHDRVAFDYWHGDDGGWIFSLLAIAIWGIYCWYSIIKPNLSIAIAKPESTVNVKND